MICQNLCPKHLSILGRLHVSIYVKLPVKVCSIKDVRILRYRIDVWPYVRTSATKAVRIEPKRAGLLVRPWFPGFAAGLLQTHWICFARNVTSAVISHALRKGNCLLPGMLELLHYTWSLGIVGLWRASGMEAVVARRGAGASKRSSAYRRSSSEEKKTKKRVREDIAQRSLEWEKM